MAREGFLMPFRWPFSQACRSFSVQSPPCPLAGGWLSLPSLLQARTVLWTVHRSKVSSTYFWGSCSEMGRGMENWPPGPFPHVCGHPYEEQWYMTDKMTPTNCTDSSLPCGRNKLKPYNITQSIWAYLQTMDILWPHTELTLTGFFQWQVWSLFYKYISRCSISHSWNSFISNHYDFVQRFSPFYQIHNGLPLPYNWKQPRGPKIKDGLID